MIHTFRILRAGIDILRERKTDCKTSKKSQTPVAIREGVSIGEARQWNSDTLQSLPQKQGVLELMIDYAFDVFEGDHDAGWYLGESSCHGRRG